MTPGLREGGRIKSYRYNIVFALLAFVIAGFYYSGVVLENDATGRLIYGAIWTLVGFFWLIRRIRHE